MSNQGCKNDNTTMLSCPVRSYAAGALLQAAARQQSRAFCILPPSKHKDREATIGELQHHSAPAKPHRLNQQGEAVLCGVRPVGRSTHV